MAKNKFGYKEMVASFLAIFFGTHITAFLIPMLDKLFSTLFWIEFSIIDSAISLLLAWIFMKIIKKL